MYKLYCWLLYTYSMPQDLQTQYEEGGRRACLVTPDLVYVKGGKKRNKTAKIINEMSKN